MEFSYQTRQKYAERKLDEWKKTQPLKRMTLSAQQKNLLETILNTGSWSRPDASNYVEFWEKDQRGEKNITIQTHAQRAPEFHRLLKLYIFATSYFGFWHF